MTENTTAGPSLFTTLQAHDAPALIDFLTGAFGFVETARYPDGDRIAHAELRWPEGRGGVMLGSHREGNTCAQPPGGASSYIVTADPDALYERATAHGAQIELPLDDMPYGSREFTARDPEGNLWSFGSYAGEALAG